MKWKDLEYRAIDIEESAVDLLLNTMRGLYINGGVIFKCFQPEDDAAFELVASTDLQGMDHIFLTFLSRRSVRKLVPELWPEEQGDQPPTFRYVSAFCMEGHLTHLLLAGGAYKEFNGTVDDARTLSRNFTEALFGDRFRSVSVATSNQPWTAWFYDIACDST